MVSTPLFSFDNVLHESQETVSCIYFKHSLHVHSYKQTGTNKCFFSFLDQVSAIMETPNLFQKKLYIW